MRVNIVKQRLLKHAKEKGLTENFGQKEIQKLEDSPLYNPYGTPEQREFANSVRALERWAMNLSLNDIR